jgi:hypothetical protein
VRSVFAKFVAAHDLTRVHRLFLRLRNSACTLEKSAEYGRRFYDAGTGTTCVSATVRRTANYQVSLMSSYPLQVPGEPSAQRLQSMQWVDPDEWHR